MKKGKLFFLIILSIFIIPTCTLAKEEVYYTNDNGVSLTEKEYNFISEMYWDGFQKFVTKELYADLKSDDIFSHPIEKKVFEYNPKITRGDKVEDAARELVITKSCADNCLITVIYTWKGTPTVKSYDVIGAYFENTSLQNSPFTIAVSSVEQKFITDYKKASNGLGASFKMIQGNDAQITHSFRVSKGGHVYASYQHAMDDVSYEDSIDYTFSRFGYGNVFQFSEKSRKYYDEMNGVDIEV